MKNLSITQSFMLCSLNDKGKIPALKAEVPVCIFAGGILDLWMQNCIGIENKKLSIKGELPENLRYLKAIHDAVADSKKPMSLEKISLDFSFTFTNKKLNVLTQEVGNSLVEMECASLNHISLSGKNPAYIPDETQVERIIQTIRAEFLEKGSISDDTVAITTLLEKSNMLKNYFSKHESGLMKTRIEEIKQSQEHKIASEIVDTVTVMIAVIAAI